MKKISSRKRIDQPARKSPSKESRLESAYRALGVLASDVAKEPQITHILAQLPSGGVKRAIEFLRGSDQPEARKFISLYDDLPSSARTLLPFESICLACKIPTRRMMEVITGACFEQTANMSALLAAASHPQVVQKTVSAAKNIAYGAKDREMLHKHSGFIPVPKNTTNIISRGAIQQNLQDNSQNLTITPGEVPQIESKMSRIADRFNERLGLGAGPTPPLQIESGPPPETAPEEPIDADWS